MAPPLPTIPRGKVLGAELHTAWAPQPHPEAKNCGPGRTEARQPVEGSTCLASQPATLDKLHSPGRGLGLRQRGICGSSLHEDLTPDL